MCYTLHRADATRSVRGAHASLPAAPWVSRLVEYGELGPFSFNTETLVLVDVSAVHRAECPRYQGQEKRAKTPL